MEILRTLEGHYKDMQDTEFTVEDGQLYMLQTRNAKRPGAGRGALRGRRRRARGCSTKEEALATIDAEHARRAAAPDLRPRRRVRGAREGVAASPGAAKGEIVFTAEEAVAGRAGRARRDPRAAVHRGRRRRRLPRRQGDPHQRGRQGLARGAGGARDGRARRWSARSDARDRPRREDGPRRRHDARRGRPDRDRRHRAAA